MCLKSCLFILKIKLNVHEKADQIYIFGFRTMKNRLLHSPFVFNKANCRLKAQRIAVLIQFAKRTKRNFLKIRATKRYSNIVS